MPTEFEKNLEKYAEVILKVGLNLQPKQHLLIGGPTSFSDGVPFEVAPLVRIIAEKAYRMGAKLVDVIWADEQLRMIRLQNSPKKLLREYPKWKIDARFNISQAGDANLIFLCPNPNLLKNVDPSSILKFQFFLNKQLQSVTKLVGANALNWSIISIPTAAWAEKLFPNIKSEEATRKLWDIIFEVCRVIEDDPVSAWQTHIENLNKRCSYLNKKQYKALKLTSPETDLTIGIAKDHIWHGGNEISQKGISFTANMPTEEIFTIPHKDKVEGVVKITKPLIIEGQLIEEATFQFSNGEVMNVNAKFGENTINSIINFDDGARRLGEIALVPHSSPVSRKGMIFYNALIDENASNHIALGSAYRPSLKNGNDMTDEEFTSAGGNDSIIHLDMMIGSGEMNVDGITEDDKVEAIMRNGEWAFEV
ncbi:MAG: aminopeptidase [Promethearchaeota archaeon]